jgi:hypothetical protein
LSRAGLRLHLHLTWASVHRHAVATRSHAAGHTASGQALRLLRIELVRNIVARIASAPRHASAMHLPSPTHLPS